MLLFWRVPSATVRTCFSRQFEIVGTLGYYDSSKPYGASLLGGLSSPWYLPVAVESSYTGEICIYFHMGCEKLMLRCNKLPKRLGKGTVPTTFWINNDY